MEKYSKSVICLVESIQLIRMPGFLLLLSLIVASHSLDLESYGHSAVLDGDAKYKVHWSYQGDTITFLLQVETLGYVGFGFSHKGGMTFSDIVIGGVENGKPYLQDYYTDVNRVPQRDSQQDYNLEYAKENGTHTILQFKRKLNTCDKNDKIITESTMRVIWAYHEDDIENGVLQHHGMNRGQKSLRLLNSEKTSELPLETNYFNFTNVDVPIPGRDTIYWCQMFKMPTLNKKHHVIKVEPLIQKGHENLVHHILIYECMRNANDEVLSYGHECYHPNMPDVFYTCETVLYGWAIGGEGFTYPPHVGLSIGLSTDPKYVLMEIHYDNPSRKKGFIDNSGIRLYYTPHLRKYDAGVLQTGIFVNPYHMIPPGMTKFISEGHCTMECLKEALNAEKPTGIHVFAVLLHTHLTGRAIRTRHFRRGEEQKLLAYDNEFDFNFQESQYLKEERTILPGDNLITECQYNTKQRTTMTLGGLSTTDEMCLSFLMYYPRIKLAKCETSPGIREQLSFIGVKELYKPKGSSTFLIKSPQKYNNLTVTDAMNTFPWSEENGKSFNDRVRQIPIIIQCSKHEYYTWMVHGEIVSPPNVTNSYMQESFICDSSSYCLNINTFDYLFIVLCSLCSYFVLY